MGVTFTAGSNGRAAISGIPPEVPRANFVITIVARNSAGQSRSQVFTLQIR